MSRDELLAEEESGNVIHDEERRTLGMAFWTTSTTTRSGRHLIELTAGMRRR